MVPPLPELTDESEWEYDPPRVVPVLPSVVRVALIAIAVGLVGIFAIAIKLDPYRGGTVWSQGTHQQLGLPPCTFVVATGGLPCPSCGMSTSFALLIRGDLWNSIQANFVGTMLALVCLAYVPWAFYCAIRGRSLWITSMEQVLVRLIVVFMVLTLLRWLVVVALHYM